MVEIPDYPTRLLKRYLIGLKNRFNDFQMWNSFNTVDKLTILSSHHRTKHSEYLKYNIKCTEPTIA